MRSLITILVMAVVFCPLTANATIINIPGDYPTIQEGIDHSSDGDTVLVQPDTYYENLNFNGHNVVLASLFLTTGDTVYISSTVIDGDSAGSVIRFSSGEDSTAQVVGFTVQNGSASSGGGIYCDSSSPTIRDNTICRNRVSHEDRAEGGGIYCSYSNPTISSNRIRENEARALEGNAYSCGGGISCYHSSPTISDNTIRLNRTRGSKLGFGGGIYCDNSAPNIHGNTISGNSARMYGGAICCSNGSPTITHNTITGNDAKHGGGIGCWQRSSPEIANNSISGNSAEMFGGGIYCGDSCNPTISYNTITDNQAEQQGGGIECHLYSHASINNNAISGNSAGLYSGGGINCINWSSPTISSNTITGNSVTRSDGWGGGIHISGSCNPQISNNTVSRNWAHNGGGLGCRYNSNPTITNTILWGDTGLNGPEIRVENSNPTITFCDVQGGWPGTGNIDADPIFVGPYNTDFYLRWRSPCIDAGDPDPSYHDPDGTRNDMGASYFNQDVDGIVEVYPLGEPIVIPPEGGDIVYDGWVFNFFGHAGRVDIWTYAFVPEMGRYGPIDLYENVRIPADSIGMSEISQHVPGVAPAGDYVFVAYVGDYPAP